MVEVSIVVPVYNVECYLRECMDSIVRQTLKNIEVICINDGSTDSSLEILNEYARKDERIIVVDKENGGYGVGMNIGMAKATGEYIGIVEPDDFVPLSMYEDLYHVAKKNNLDFVKADFYRFTRDEETGNMNLMYNHLDRSGEFYNWVLAPKKYPCVTKFIMNTWSGIYKRSYLEEHHIRHHETPGASFQDNGFFWQTFMYADRCMFLDKPYYMNRRDNPNSSVNSRTKVYCMNQEYDYIRDIFMQKGNEELWECFKYYYNHKRYYNYTFTLNRIDEKFKREYVNNISYEFKRSENLGELDFNLFNEYRRKQLRILIDNPEDFYKKYAHKKKPLTSEEKIEKLEKEIAQIRGSVSFRVGKKITSVPRKVKQVIKGR